MKKSRKKEINSEPSAIVPINTSIDDHDIQHVILHHDLGHALENNNNIKSKNLVNNNAKQSNGSDPNDDDCKTHVIARAVSTAAIEATTKSTNDGNSADERTNDICGSCDSYEEDVIRYIDSSSVNSDRVDAQRKSDTSSSNNGCSTSNTTVKLRGHPTSPPKSMQMLAGGEIELKQLDNKMNRVRFYNIDIIILIA